MIATKRLTVDGQESKAEAPPKARRHGMDGRASATNILHMPGVTYLYCDASFSAGKQPGIGWAFVALRWEVGGAPACLECSGYMPLTDFGAGIYYGELYAIFQGLSSLIRKNQHVIVLSDNSKVIDALAAGQRYYSPTGLNLRRERLKRLRQKIENDQTILPKALFNRTLGLALDHDVQWLWVRGHAGDVFNERVDSLAYNARLGRRGLREVVNGVKVNTGHNRHAHRHPSPHLPES